MFKKSPFYGKYGGAYVPEMLIPALQNLENAFLEACDSDEFKSELEGFYKNYVGRPTPLYFAKNLTEDLGGAKLFFKNEGLAHTGAHKINHCVGQILLAQQMKKKRIVAETGAGQHGLATAAVAAKFNMDCTIYMGEVDYNRQRSNVFWMERFGAKVIPVEEGSKTLKDAVNMAIKDWINDLDNTYYLLGSALGPYPYPSIIRYFQSIVGKETKLQLEEYGVRYPDYVVACVGGGSNAIGIFSAFLNDDRVKLIGVEAGGKSSETGMHASRLSLGGREGIIEGYKSFFLQNEDGQVESTTSVSAGLDYAGVGPEHAFLSESKRVEYVSADDKEAISAFEKFSSSEGILPALESSHAIAHVIKIASSLGKDKTIVVNLSGRGDKDLFILAEYLKDEKFFEFLKSFSK